jgi:hypothetical protein
VVFWKKEEGWGYSHMLSSLYARVAVQGSLSFLLFFSVTFKRWVVVILFNNEEIHIKRWV